MQRHRPPRSPEFRYEVRHGVQRDRTVHLITPLCGEAPLALGMGEVNNTPGFIRPTNWHTSASFDVPVRNPPWCLVRRARSELMRNRIRGTRDPETLP
jgi:hypothetical protein